MMDFLPLFFDLKQSLAMVFGDTDAAARKVEVLLSSGCRVVLIAQALENNGFQAALGNSLFSHREVDDEALWGTAHLVVAATGLDIDQIISEKAKSKNLPINVVNRADLSSFVFPSIIDRSPIIAAVSSSGELPVLTRLLRSQLEASIPHAYGRLATIAKKYRQQVKDTILGINARRRFWENHLEGQFADLVFSGKESEAEALLKKQLACAVDGDTGCWCPVCPLYAI